MGKAVRVTVTIPEDIVAAVDKIARRTKASRSKVVTLFLDQAQRDARRKALMRDQTMSRNAELQNAFRLLTKSGPNMSLPKRRGRDR
jgi:metal-responsive CopG/Arc/MetJ family transcriptional regulator